MGKTVSKLRIIAWVIATAALAAYVVLAPSIIERGMRFGEYGERFRREREPYSGEITVWHIVSFRPYLGSAGNWLSKRAAEVEKAHFGVYFNVTAMSIEECALKLENGECADVYSFPSGWCAHAALHALDVELPERMSQDMAALGQAEGEQYAVPLFYSVYSLLVNARIASEKGVGLPSDAVTRAFVSEACDKLDFSLKSGRVYGMAGNAVVAALYGAHGDIAGVRAFRDGDASMAVADMRFVGDMDRFNKSGKGFEFALYPLSAYTDLVQFIGVNADVEAAKLPYCFELIELAVSDGAQLALAQIGLFGSVTPEDATVYEQEHVQLAFDAAHGVSMANTFEHYRRRDEISRLAARALAGGEDDSAALADALEELVRELKIE
ncbi:MAG: hypothetical protein Q4B99_00795 [Clostridia bacterium]|nr:hypothetical protein [Clostridia bacterium]